MNKILFLLLFTISIGWSGVAQDESNLQHQTYYYTVENVQSEDQLLQVVSAFESLKFVEKVKLNYKQEKSNRAQFVVYVIEPIRTSESQQMFEMTDLKKIVVENNLQPTELKIDNH